MNASVIQAFQWLIWEKKHEFKMAKWQLQENIFRFINILLYTDHCFSITITSISSGLK